MILGIFVSFPTETNHLDSYSNARKRGNQKTTPEMGSGYGEKKPVEVGKEYDVEVIEFSRRGDGVARIQGFVIFVQGAKVGQKVKIKVDRVGPRFASASVVGHVSGGAKASEAK